MSEVGNVSPIGSTLGPVRDAIMQVTTLSVGVLAVSVTFSNNFRGRIPADLLWLLFMSWLLFLLSAIMGVISLHALAGIAYQGGDIYEARLRVPWIVMEVLFILALVAFLLIAGKAL